MLSEGRTDDWGEVADTPKMTFHDALYFIIVTFRYCSNYPAVVAPKLAVPLVHGFVHIESETLCLK